MIFTCVVGIPNYLIYMTTIDYMVAAYGPFSSSATGGRGFARDILCGVAALYSAPFYENLGGKGYRLHLEWPSFILGILGGVLMIPVYVFYNYGSWFREKSPSCQALAGKD
jgi:hypothetical protein